MPLLPIPESRSTDGADVAALAAHPAVEAALERFAAEEDRYRDWQIELTRIPAPPFGEVARGQWLAQRFAEIGLAGIHRDEVGNILAMAQAVASKALSAATETAAMNGADSNAYSEASAQLNGNGRKPCITVISHIDTVFPPHTHTEVREEGSVLLGPGISDNSAGVTAMLAVAEAIRAMRIPLRLPVLFVGSVGEEGEGDLRGVRHLFGEESAWRYRTAAAIAVDGAGTDNIVAEALGSRRFEVTLRGPGGHSWSDAGAPSPIFGLARALERFSQVILPQSPTAPKSAINVGTIEGGTSVNSIPEWARARVDIRSAGAAELDRLERALRLAVAHGVESENRKTLASPGRVFAPLTSELKIIGDRPAGELMLDSALLRVLRSVDAHLGIKAQIQRASTDANIPLSLGIEAVAIGGGGSGGGAHTLQEWFDCTGREVGLRRVLLTVLGMAGLG